MAINLSQFASATAASVSSLNALFSSAVSSGSLIVTHVSLFTVAGGAVFSNIVDNVNAGNYTIGCNSTMSNASDTVVHAVIGYKTGISSGVAGGSTYRVSVNCVSGALSLSMCALQYTGGPWSVGSTASANGTSSSPAPGATTASSNPALWVASAVYNTAGTLFNSTINTGAWRTTVDPTNANQVIAVADSTNSSLTQNPTFGLTTSTRWLANSIVFLGLGSGGAAAQTFVDGFPLFGCV